MAATSTTTVRLGDEDVQRLDDLAPAFGGRSGAIRAAIRLLAAQHERQVGLRSVLDDWNDEIGHPDEAEVDAMLRYLGR